MPQRKPATQRPIPTRRGDNHQLLILRLPRESGVDGEWGGSRVREIKLTSQGEKEKTGKLASIVYVNLIHFLNSIAIIKYPKEL